MDNILIGLVAPKRSGKDTAANYLCSSYGFKKYNFADPLKRGIGEIFGLTYNQLDGDEKEIIDPFWGVTPRELLQKIGTELFQFELPKVVDQFKDFDRTFWVKCFEKWYTEKEKLFNQNKTTWSNSVFDNMIKGLPHDFLYKNNPSLKIVVSDIRFLHEAKKIKDLNGLLIKINRNNKQNEYSSHKSEIEFNEIKCDYTIENDGDILNLHKKIDTLIKNFK